MLQLFLLTPLERRVHSMQLGADVCDILKAQSINISMDFLRHWVVLLLLFVVFFLIFTYIS